MDDKEIYPFSLRLPVPYAGNIYDRKNESAAELKSFLRLATGDILKSNQLGQLAAGLVHGQICRIGNQQPQNLYSLAEEGRGITFHEPETLYHAWHERELKVGETMQSAMRNIINFALEGHTR